MNIAKKNTFKLDNLSPARFAKWMLIQAVIVLVLTASGQILAATMDTYPAPGLMVRVGEHRLHLYCTGRGEPTVVMDSGLGGNSLDWTRVQPEVAAYTRVCTYDRAGYGWSELGPLPRTSEKIADELHTLLKKAGVLGPYILVGHSFGGYNVRLFASRYPQETAGIILVDAAHEDQFKYFRRNGIVQHSAGASFMMSGPSIPNNLPDDVRPIAQAHVEKTKAFLALRGEMVSFQRSADQVSQSKPLPDVPFSVITRGKRVWPHTEKGNRMETIWSELQDDLATRISYHRNEADAYHIFAKQSGHYVHLDEPGVVVNAIRKLVNYGRDNRDTEI